MCENIEQFLSSAAFGVIGASANRAKFGNMVLRCYQQNSRVVYPVNPQLDEVEGLVCLKSINDLPDNVKSISVITPPSITEQVVELAHSKGIKNIWMQPGAESELAVQKCVEYGINVIADGSCILVMLGFPH